MFRLEAYVYRNMSISLRGDFWKVMMGKKGSNLIETLNCYFCVLLISYFFPRYL